MLDKNLYLFFRKKRLVLRNLTPFHFVFFLSSLRPDPQNDGGGAVSGASTTVKETGMRRFSHGEEILFLSSSRSPAYSRCCRKRAEEWTKGKEGWNYVTYRIKQRTRQCNETKRRQRLCECAVFYVVVESRCWSFLFFVTFPEGFRREGKVFCNRNASHTKDDV